MKYGVNLLKGLLVLGLIGCAITLPRHLSASSDSPWFNSGNPGFLVKSAAISDADYPATVTQRGNIDCSNLTFTHRDGGLFSLIPRLYKESKVSGCYVKSTVGAIDSNGYVNVNGTDYVADMVNAAGSPASFRAFPNTDVFISNSSGAAVGAYVWFDHLQSSLSFSGSIDGKMSARIKPTNQVQLIDKSGAALPVMADNLGLSDNGDWLVVDSPGRALIRVNLKTMEVLPFDTSFEFGNGIGAALRYAISGDGRFVAVSSKAYTYFRIFDLSTCVAVPNKITAPVNCQSRDLNTFTRTQIGDMGGILQMRFSSENLLRFYATHDISSAPKTGYYAIAAPGTSLAGMDYLALGDSFSAGEGAQKYEIGTDENNINLCHLSRVSFPYLISQQLGTSNFHSVACSGAKTLNLTGGSGISKDNSNESRDNQYNDKPTSNSLGSWIPGYIKQLEFVSENAPHLITVTASGNDIGFAEKLKSCVKPGTCYPSYEDKQEVFNEVDGKLGVITDMYQKIKKEAPKDARIYAIGYPQVALPGGNCGLNVHFNQQELIFAGTLIIRLNAVIKTAAARAGVTYTDIEDALNGYRLCENDSGNIAMNGLTSGKDKYGLIGNESYHPNEFGQFLMAQKILGITSNLGSFNPASNPAAALVKITVTDPVFAESTKTNRPINKLLNFQMPEDVAYRGQTLTTKLNGIAYALPPSTVYQTSIDNMVAGQVTTDLNGNLNITLPIPQETEPGIHTVHVYGTDVTGQPIDISTIVTIGSSPTDFNGNGTPDTAEQCAPIQPSNIDFDKDGIDDACDDNIGSAPVELVIPTPPQEPVTPPSPTQIDSPAPTDSAATPPNQTTTPPVTIPDIPPPDVPAANLPADSENNNALPPAPTTQETILPTIKQQQSTPPDDEDRVDQQTISESVELNIQVEPSTSQQSMPATPEDSQQSIGLVQATEIILSNKLGTTNLNPAPFVKAAKASIVEKASTRPKQFLILLIVIAVFLIFIFIMRKRKQRQEQRYVAYA